MSNKNTDAAKNTLWRVFVSQQAYLGNLADADDSTVMESYLIELLSLKEISFYINYDFDAEQFLITTKGVLYVSEQAALALEELIYEVKQAKSRQHYKQIRNVDYLPDNSH